MTTYSHKIVNGRQMDLSAAEIAQLEARDAEATDAVVTQAALTAEQKLALTQAALTAEQKLARIGLTVAELKQLLGK